MPYTRAQQRLFGADLARARAGKKTRTGMSEDKLAKYAAMPPKPKSKMPKGASLSPKGDLGYARCEEAKKAVPVKGQGSAPKSPFSSEIPKWW